MNNQWCPQQERFRTGNTCSGAKHGKQMASNRALSVQCRVVGLEKKTGRKKKTQSGWMISGHLSALQQGVIFKREENSLSLFLQIWSLQQIEHHNCPYCSSVCEIVCRPVPQWQCIMMCFKMLLLVSGYFVVTLIFSHNLFIVPLVCLPFGSLFSFHPPTLSASQHALSSSASCCIVFRGGSARS